MSRQSERILAFAAKLGYAVECAYVEARPLGKGEWRVVLRKDQEKTVVTGSNDIEVVVKLKAL